MTTYLWAFLLIVIGGGIEIWTILNKKPNDTFSVAFMWKLRQYGISRAFMFGGLWWVMYHGYLEPEGAEDTMEDDLWLVLGAMIGTVVKRHPRDGR